MAAVAEKPQTQNNPLPEDDFYSEDGSDYDSYSEDDLDEPVTESDAENEGGQLQRRRKLQAQQGQGRNFDYYDDDDDDYDSEEDEDYDSEEDEAGAVAPYARNDNSMQQNRQGGGRMEPAADAKGSIDDEDGLKLKVEVNLEVEIELKAAIHGDLTLSLLA